MNAQELYDRLQAEYREIDKQYCDIKRFCVSYEPEKSRYNELKRKREKLDIAMTLVWNILHDKPLFK